MILRRWCIAVAIVLIATPVLAGEKTVGVVMSGNIGYYQEIHRAFANGLIKEGYDRRKVDTLLQMPAPDPLSWTNAVRKMIVADVNVMVAYGAASALSAIKETKSVPIVYAGVYDPAGIGIVAKNITGITSKVPLTSLLKYAKKLVPFTKLAVVYNELEPDSVKQVEELGALESQYGFQVVRMPVKRVDEAKALTFAGKADIVLISVSAVANEALDAIVKTTHASKIPTLSQLGGAGDRGVILTLAPSAAEQGEAAARICAKLLNGDNPASIAPEVPKLVELVLNMKEASAMGLKPSVDLMTDATRVIK
ncbi:MAG: ABC transporter substrate-binding protein [Nitrospiraceae bacterium]|nr:ABC transporter substrate-binding protein [Nitrospiraceae bacterium]